MEPWFFEYLRQCYDIALDSPDTSTQNGAMVLDGNNNVLGVGINTFTKGMAVTPDLLERPKKYTYIEHAERNAIYDVVAHSPQDSALSKPHTMVAAWAACADCSRGIAQSGIRTLIRHAREDESGRWPASIEDGDKILKAAGVEIIEVNHHFGLTPILIDGKLWTP